MSARKEPLKWLVTVHLSNGIYDQIVVTTNLPQNVQRLAEQQSGGKVVCWCRFS